MKVKINKANRYTFKRAGISRLIVSCCLSLSMFLLLSQRTTAQPAFRAAFAPIELKDSVASGSYRTAFFGLIQSKDYFEAKAYYSRNRMRLSSTDQLFSKAFLAGALHQPALALQCTEELLNNPERLPDSLQLMLLDLQQNSAASLGQYAAAKDAARQILAHHMDRLSPGVLKLQHNNYDLWSALVKSPAQTMEISQDVRLSMYRDSMGMRHIQFGGATKQDFDFVFDPAAKVSTANASTAAKLKMRYLPGTLSVASATGHLVPAKIAICDSLVIDAIKLQNVVFLVLSDTALSVPKMHYQIRGVLGLPVLQAMREIQLRGGNEFIVPKEASVKRRGLPLMIHQGQLIVAIAGSPYELYPGTDKSLLFHRYFDANESMVKLQGRPINMELGDPGMSSVTKGYQFDYPLRVKDRTVTIENTAVLTTELPTAGHLYGRLGQDFIRLFDTLTINFDKMFVDLQ